MGEEKMQEFKKRRQMEDEEEKELFTDVKGKSGKKGGKPKKQKHNEKYDGGKDNVDKNDGGKEH
eukprot:5753137-Ditylum_brightwellii.AAC.1